MWDVDVNVGVEPDSVVRGRPVLSSSSSSLLSQSIKYLFCAATVAVLSRTPLKSETIVPEGSASIANSPSPAWSRSRGEGGFFQLVVDTCSIEDWRTSTMVASHGSGKSGVEEILVAVAGSHVYVGPHTSLYVGITTPATWGFVKVEYME